MLLCVAMVCSFSLPSPSSCIEYHVFEYISIMSFGEYIRVCFFIGMYLGVGLLYYADKVLFLNN